MTTPSSDDKPPKMSTCRRTNRFFAASARCSFGIYEKILLATHGDCAVISSTDDKWWYEVIGGNSNSATDQT